MKTIVEGLIVYLLVVGPVRAEPFSFAAVGDYPRNASQDIRFRRFYTEIDSRPEIRFVLHVGDFKPGGTDCGESIFRNRLNLFGECPRPLILLPGDNEFNDCSNPEQAIGYFRRYFCQGKRSLGRKNLPLDRQAGSGDHPPFPEHVRWWCDRVLFTGLNVVGSANNRKATEEWRRRTEAGTAWLAKTFEEAVSENAAAVVVAIHANPFRSDREPYEPFLETLTASAEAFGRPVLLIHGDSHYFRFDMPFEDERGFNQPNLFRLETFGAPNPHWVEVMVDPTRPEVFSPRVHSLR